MNRKEQRRLVVLNQVEVGRMTGREAEVLGLSLRHVRRLLAAYRKEGAAALAHGNRGRKPANALGDGLKRQVVGLAQSTYARAESNRNFGMGGGSDREVMRGLCDCGCNERMIYYKESG